MLHNLCWIASQVLFCFFIRKVFEGLWPLNFKYRRKEIRNFIHLTADSIITWTKTTMVVILLCCCIAVSKVLWRDTMHLTYNLTTQHSSRVLSKIMSYPLAAASVLPGTRASGDSIGIMATLWTPVPQGHGLSILAVMAQWWLAPAPGQMRGGGGGWSLPRNAAAAAILLIWRLILWQNCLHDSGATLH